jgi:hypothetical protein
LSGLDVPDFFDLSGNNGNALPVFVTQIYGFWKKVWTLLQIPGFWRLSVLSDRILTAKNSKPDKRQPPVKRAECHQNSHHYIKCLRAPSNMRVSPSVSPRAGVNLFEWDSQVVPNTFPTRSQIPRFSPPKIPKTFPDFDQSPSESPQNPLLNPHTNPFLERVKNNQLLPQERA